MTTLAEVFLWGTRIGAVSMADEATYGSFQYDPDFVRSGIQVSPITMPLRQAPYRFPGLALRTFHGLPGLLSDSLPDKYGNALINEWLARSNRLPGSFNAVERLCYTGNRGMGAIEFRPASGPTPMDSEVIDIAKLVELATQVLRERDGMKASFSGEGRADALREILRVGTSAGGARAKAVVAWNPVTNEVRSGQAAVGSGFEHWLMKFDGVSNNKDHEISDPQGYGVVEFAYSKMAAAAKVNMNPCHLLEEGGRRHFMTRRFDRDDAGEKMHMQSLCAIAHYDFNEPMSYSYEQAFLVMRQLQLPLVQLEQQFRRMVFNVIARNQDDHVKNIAFLMGRDGTWRLSPAFDVTWSYNPHGDWTARHQMSLNGKRDGFVREDIKAAGQTAGLTSRRTVAVLDEVLEAVSHWKMFAHSAGVLPSFIVDIQATLRLDV